MIDVLGHRQAPGAEASLIPGMIGVALDLDQSAVLDVSQDAAPTVAAGTGGPSGGAHNLAVSTRHLRLLQLAEISYNEQVTVILHQIVLRNKLSPKSSALEAWTRCHGLLVLNF